MPENEPTDQPDVLVVLADTIQNQAQMYGQTVQAVNALHSDNTKIIDKLGRIAEKVGVKEGDSGDNRSSETRAWTENKLLMVFLIIMALAILVLAGAKMGEVTGFFGKVLPHSSVEKDADKEK
jgi:hypothetical protein